MSKEITLSDATFEQDVLQSDKPILVDFWAPWCGPCRFVGPILSEIAEERADTLKIGKLNVDDNRETAMKYQVASIPTLILFKDGEAVERVIGALPKQMIEQTIDKVLT